MEANLARNHPDQVRAKGSGTTDIAMNIHNFLEETGFNKAKTLWQAKQNSKQK